MTHARSGGTKQVILCIEDEPHLRRDIVDELSMAGYEAVGSGDGLHALDLLESVRPDFILCDIAIPGLDGYGLLDAVRAKRPDLADVPFVFLTAFNQREEIINGRRAGADEYLVKPIDFDLLLACIEARLGQVGRMNDKKRRELQEVRSALEDRNVGSSADTRERLAGILDILAFGAVLLDEEGGVVLANRAARALHREEDGIVIDSRLYSGTSLRAGELRSVLTRVGAAAKSGKDHTASLTLQRPSGRRDYVLIACALPAGASADAGRARSVVFISDPERRPTMPDAVLCDLFGLTPSETAIAQSLASGRRTDQIAAELGVSQTTIAFHMRNIFQKTDTHRQADLIALVLTGIATIEPDTARFGEGVVSATRSFGPR